MILFPQQNSKISVAFVQRQALSLCRRHGFLDVHYGTRVIQRNTYGLPTNSISILLQDADKSYYNILITFTGLESLLPPRWSSKQYLVTITTIFTSNLHLNLSCHEGISLHRSSSSLISDKTFLPRETSPIKILSTVFDQILSANYLQGLNADKSVSLYKQLSKCDREIT